VDREDGNGPSYRVGYSSEEEKRGRSDFLVTHPLLVLPADVNRFRLRVCQACATRLTVNGEASEYQCDFKVTYPLLVPPADVSSIRLLDSEPDGELVKLRNTQKVNILAS